MASLARTLASKAGRTAAVRMARPTAMFLARRNPLVLAAVTLAPAAVEFGKAAIDAFNEVVEDLDTGVIEGTVVRDVRTPRAGH